MRYLITILLITLCLCANSQTAYLTDSSNGCTQRTEIKTKTIEELPNLIWLKIDGFFYVQVPKSIFTPSQGGGISQQILNDTSTAIRTTINGKQNTITTGTTAQYFKGDLSLATFPTTTASFSNSTNKNFVTDAQLTVIGNTSGTNSGDNAANSLYSGLVSNATHTGDATGSTALTVVKINGVALSGLATGILKNTTGTGVPSIAVAGDFPTLNQNTTGTAGGLSANIAESQVTNLVSDLAAKQATIVAGTTLGIPIYARVSGSNFTTTGQALANITGLSVALTTNAVYEFEAVLSVSTTAVTTGTQYGVNYSVAGGAVEAQVRGSLTSALVQAVRLSALNSATVAFLTTSAQSGGILIKGIVTTGANAGNFTVSTLKVTSGTSTVFINSYLKVTRIQ